MPTKANEWLEQQHPLYKLRRQEWEQNERRFAGGLKILQELRPFDWETFSTNAMPVGERAIMGLTTELNALLQREGSNASFIPGAHYRARQNETLYINFPEIFANLLVGHLFRSAPAADEALSFGTMGAVRRADRTKAPTPAEQLYYNADGVGNDGSQWDNFWARVTRRAMTTGHQWVMVESPAIRPATRAEELAGRRPYLINYSPLQVLNWEYLEGRLMFAVVKFYHRSLKLVDGSLEGNDSTFGYRLLVAQGCDWFGPQYTGGGWWEFDHKTDPIAERKGDWASTEGQIPMWAHFYERHEQEFSRSGLTELGNAAIAYMNIDSAASFDAWDAASSMQFLLGVDPDAFNLAMNKVLEGSRWIPLPVNELNKTLPQVQDGSTGAVVAEVFDKRLKTIRDTVREIAALEAIGSPDSSGLSKQMGFLDVKSPRLRMLASEIESSQNTAIAFLERRWGNAKPTGVVTWPRDFDLSSLMDKINDYFIIQLKSKSSSPTITARAMLRAAKEAGLITDEQDAEKMLKEFESSAIRQEELAERQLTVMQEFGGEGDGATSTPPEAE